MMNEDALYYPFIAWAAYEGYSFCRKAQEISRACNNHGAVPEQPLLLSFSLSRVRECLQEYLSMSHSTIFIILVDL